MRLGRSRKDLFNIEGGKAISGLAEEKALRTRPRYVIATTTN